MACVGRRRARLFSLVSPAIFLAPALFAQAPATIETVPDPARIPPAEVPFVNPLWQALAAPAELKGPPPKPKDLEATSTLFVAARIDETGKVSEAFAPEPPVRALGAAAAAQAPRWVFKPAKKDGQPVRCWGTYAVKVRVDLEEAVWQGFNLAPVAKADPLPALAKEMPGETWLSRYPSAVTPPEPGVHSVEEVDFLPMPEKVPIKVDSTRLKSRLTALVEVSGLGSVKRVVPVGTYEPLILQWVRESAKGWTLSPAKKGGSPASSWLALDATIEYAIGSYKEREKSSFKKNLRGAPLP